MYRNTYLLVCVLAIIAALVIGVNIGRQVVQSPSSTPTPIVTPPQEATLSRVKPYRNAFCNVAFDYPDDFTLIENASGSAAFTGPAADEGILLTCQKDIPRPAIAQENVEDIRIGSVAAKLYNNQSLIFRHPGTKLDVFLAGTGEVFQNLLQTLTIF